MTALWKNELWAIAVLVVVCVHFYDPASAVTCYSCQDVNSTSSCSRRMTCEPNQKCYTETTGIQGKHRFNMGCKSEQACQAYNSGSPGLAGRRFVLGDSSCHQCCAVNLCNSQLCAGIDNLTVQHPEVCEDDPTYNCAGLSSLSNLCGNVLLAKQVCRKWCGLCELVDGNWAAWSTWSGCSVTCEDGHMTRTRNCSNPAPSHGGQDCLGNGTDSIPCHNRIQCPGSGGWSTWLPWEQCSVSCGVGMRKRKRTCNNPVPSNGGHYCYGDGNDFSLCTNTPCGRVGGWSSWGSWSDCSATCSFGLKTKTRSCTDPTPSEQGQPCIGDSKVYSICFGACDNVQEHKVRLMDGTANSGRVEILFAGVWGTVCDDGFDSKAATVVCRMLGLRHSSAIAYTGSHFKAGTGPVWIDDVNCTGLETSLAFCRFPRWGAADCSHHEDAGVLCV